MEAPPIRSPASAVPPSFPRGWARRLAPETWIFVVTVVLCFALVLVLLGISRLVEGKAPALGTYRTVGEFELVERSGRAISLADWRGKIVVVDFFFGGCSAQCLTLGAQMAELQQLTAGMSDVQLASITIDPGSDTPAVLTRYADRLQADPMRWQFLTGDRRVIQPLVKESFLLALGDVDSIPGKGSGTSLVHSDRIVLVDAHGVVRAYYDGMDARSVQRILAGIQSLLQEQQLR